MIGQTFGKLSERNQKLLVSGLFALLVFLVVVSPVAAVLLGLFIFGTVYDGLISAAQLRKLTEGYTALLVVIGTLVTIGGIHLLSLLWTAPAALLALLAFAASGTPMAIGDIARYLQMRERERKEMRDL